MTPNTTDVLVIGGGPAGTTFGHLAAQRGWQVTLLEKDKHPRFHIGESLLPMNLPIFERLGILDEVKDIGVPKLGADFTIANSNGRHETFYFSKALGESPDHAFEVRRSEFDQLLFEHCKAAGVNASEGTKVTHVERLESGSHRVTAVDTDGEEVIWETRFLVDASGRDTFMSSRNGWKKRNPKHASAAVFAHYRGVKRRAGENQGNISLYWFDHGWIWMIPLRDDIMSIGAVCYPDYIKSRREPLDEFLLNTLHRIISIRGRMRGAEAVTPAQATGNYSYLSDRMFGPGFLMIGDAFAFIDPVFSSGVYLAMNGAERGVDVAEAWLTASEGAYRKACRKYERETHKGLATFSWFIYRFTSPVMRYMFRKPRNTFRVVQGVVSMLAGDVYSNRAVRRRLLLFKTLYSVACMFNWRSVRAAWKVRRPKNQAELQEGALSSE
ncbi:MAG: tryptophan 7-halogenase [Gammaproteobacteria bacterium]|jgi:flavin-dependent dehydrogenase|nr:tryptophan 7-halogenase [Gammaproteobacteria bacterium]MDH3749073.1 tryptophan 7-halogenase [Gammaproteobacteria bacterium]MDH3804495.1 tryptophan 7-halogenase [Gammaproteobacteria bacterium]